MKLDPSQIAPGSVATLYVGNLAPTVDENILASAFQYFGSIANIQVRVQAHDAGQRTAMCACLKLPAAS